MAMFIAHILSNHHEIHTVCFNYTCDYTTIHLYGLFIFFFYCFINFSTVVSVIVDYTGLSFCFCTCALSYLFP